MTWRNFTGLSGSVAAGEKLGERFCASSNVKLGPSEQGTSFIAVISNNNQLEVRCLNPIIS
jgi:hypothetical protein